MKQIYSELSIRELKDLFNLYEKGERWVDFLHFPKREFIRFYGDSWALIQVGKDKDGQNFGVQYTIEFDKKKGKFVKETTFLGYAF